MNYILPISLASLLLFGAGCGSSPEKKVEKLQKAKAATMEESGYTKCIADVKANQFDLDGCIQKKLQAKGYTDGVNCIMDFDTGTLEFKTDICKNTTRYNAEVDAQNECLLEKPSDPLVLTLEDCLKLLQKK